MLQIYVKVTPVNLTHANSSQDNLEETLSLETMEIKDVEQLNTIAEIAVSKIFLWIIEAHRVFIKSEY